MQKELANLKGLLTSAPPPNFAKRLGFILTQNNKNCY
jgi:hypothetical protein|nr:MAG TPA: hypothetical protein [Caudoviricetes sp.]